MKKRKKKKPIDFMLLIAVISLVFIGIVMVYSSSGPDGVVRYSDSMHYAQRHIFWAFIGFFLMIAMSNLDYKIWKKHANKIFILSIFLALLLFTPLGIEIKGATRWLDLGFTTYMPSDGIKLGSILFFATFLDNKHKRVRQYIQGALPAILIIIFVVGLIYFQRDLSTAATVAGALFSMFFVAGMHLPIIVLIGLGTVGFLKIALYSEGNEYRLRRVLAFKDPFADKLGDGWQIVQSLYALGSGGIFGVGLGQSKQKFFYIPEPYNDFIFSILGEELGLIGSLFVLALYSVIIYRGFIIAQNARDAFGTYLATGITSLLAIQSFINIGVVTSSIPVTGITLPLISYGGTSLVLYLVGLGILMNISRYTTKEKKNESNN
ncbi:MAG: putative lipid II flippase FtsW [Gudongella sp.]|nr:putative lipid II flippase FtsW [Gudongella sp.]